MAETKNIPGPADKGQKDEISDQNQPINPTDSIIEIRKLFDIAGTSRIIYDISVDRGTKRTFGWKIHEGSEVEISGSNLSIFNQINLLVEGAVYPHKNLERGLDGTYLKFTVTGSIKNLYSAGAVMELEFVDSRNFRNNRFLKQKFSYNPEEEEKDDQRKQARAGDTDKNPDPAEGKKSSLISEVLNQTVLGPATAAARGFQSVKAAKASPGKVSGQSRAATGVSQSASGSASGSLDVSDASTDSDISQSTEEEISGQANISGEVSSEQESSNVSGGQSVEVRGSAASSEEREVNTPAEISAKTTAEVNANTVTEVKAQSETSFSGQQMAVGESSPSGADNVSGQENSQSELKVQASEKVILGTEVNAEITSRITASPPGGSSPAGETPGNSSESSQNSPANSSPTPKNNNQTPTAGSQSAVEPSPLVPPLSANDSQPGALPPENPAGQAAPSTSSQNVPSPQTALSEPGSSPAPQESPPISSSAAKTIPEESKKNNQLTPPSQAIAAMVDKVNRDRKVKPPVAEPGSMRERDKLRISRKGLDGIGLSLAGQEEDAGQKEERSASQDSEIENNLRDQQEVSSPTNKASQPNALPAPLENSSQNPNQEEQDQTENDPNNDSTDEQGRNPRGGEPTNEPGEENSPLQNPQRAPIDLPGGVKTRGRILDRVTKIAGKQKLLGKVSNKLWKYGFGVSAAVLFSGLDFFVGAIIMDVYWFTLHKKDPRLFPMKKWQKFMTIAAHILPFVWAGVIVVTIIAVGCNFPVPGRSPIPGIGYRGTVVGLFIGDSCETFDITKIVSNTTSSYLNNSGPNAPAAPAGGVCQAVPSGPASIAALSQTCFGQNAGKASAISFAESGGGATRASRSDVCLDGKPFSLGLFQINILVRPILDANTGETLNCQAAFRKGSPYIVYGQNGKFSHYDCSVSNEVLYNRCVSAIIDPNTNIQTACAISKNGTNWGAWSTNKKCGF